MRICVANASSSSARAAEVARREDLAMKRLLPSDEKGMEVAPRPVSKDDLPFRPRSRDGRTWIRPAAPGYDPRAEIQIEVSCSYPEGGTISVLL